MRHRLKKEKILKSNQSIVKERRRLTFKLDVILNFLIKQIVGFLCFYSLYYIDYVFRNEETSDIIRFANVFFYMFVSAIVAICVSYIILNATIYQTSKYKKSITELNNLFDATNTLYTIISTLFTAIIFMFFDLLFTTYDLFGFITQYLLTKLVLWLISYSLANKLKNNVIGSILVTAIMLVLLMMKIGESWL